MNQRRVLQGLLVLWGVWQLINAALSTFAPATGASLVGWTADWSNPQLVAMSQQYGLVLLLLGAVYLLAATDPGRYRVFVWIVVAEQLVGLAYSAYNAFGLNQITASQFLTQALVNLAVAAIFAILNAGNPPSATRATRSRSVV